jgi:hypothetical protein
MSGYEDEAVHERGEGRSHRGVDLEMPLAITVGTECERPGSEWGTIAADLEVELVRECWLSR